MKKVIFMVVIASLFLVSCAAARYDGPYNGKVIDSDTKKPIQGAVVLGVWYKVYPGAAGAINEFFDAKETLTDKNGEFSISGMGPQVLTNIDVMNVLIFKVGYEHIGMGSWNSLKNDLILRKKVKWENQKAIIPLKKWTLEERRNRFGSYYVDDVPSKKQEFLLQEIEKEKKEIGK